MKERPILFSTPMVNANLDGTKTQTRRIINPQPEVAPDLEKLVNQAWQGGWVDVACPYGEPGDRLWVREPFRTIDRYDHLSPKHLPLDARIVARKTRCSGRWHRWSSGTTGRAAA